MTKGYVNKEQVLVITDTIRDNYDVAELVETTEGKRYAVIMTEQEKIYRIGRQLPDKHNTLHPVTNEKTRKKVLSALEKTASDK